MIFKCVALYLLFTYTDGQLLDSLGGNLLQKVSTITSETLSSVIRGSNAGPMASVRASGLYGSFPTVISQNNIVDTGNFLPEFQAGLRNEDAELPVMDLVKKYGYNIEEHTVTTSDGYVLKMHRIPGNGPVLFLMHGLLGSSDDYFIAGTEDGLGYYLSREGYDVWFGNARGNKHSRRHTTMKPSEAKFWDFSWHEIGYYDLPAMIDYILFETEESSLRYVGHSQGTTAFFVMASELPEYNDKVSLMIAMSPVAWIAHTKAPLVHLTAPAGPMIHAVSKALGIYEFLPDDSILRTMKRYTCGIGPFADIICGNILFSLAGFDFEQLNVTNLPVIFGHVPSGSSAKQFAHYGQGVMGQDFRYYDYGPKGNLKRYGAELPPKYKVESITVPVCLMYSESDWMAQPQDVETLYNKLTNVLDVYKVPYARFNHLDFIWAKDVKRLIFKRLMLLLKY